MGCLIWPIEWNIYLDRANFFVPIILTYHFYTIDLTNAIFYVNVDHYNRFWYFAYNFFLKSTQSHYWCKIKLTRGEEYYVQVCTRPQTRRNPTSTHAQLLKYSKLFNITLTSSSHIVAWIRNASDFISQSPALVLWYKYDYEVTIKIFRFVIDLYLQAL